MDLGSDEYKDVNSESLNEVSILKEAIQQLPGKINLENTDRVN